MATKVYTPASEYFSRARTRLDQGELIAASAFAREAVRRALAEKCRELGIPHDKRSSGDMLVRLEPYVDRRHRLDLFIVLRVFNRSIGCCHVKPNRLGRAIDKAELLTSKIRG